MGSSTTLFTIVFLAILAVALLAVLSGNKNFGLKLPVGVSGEAADMKKAFLGIVKSEIKTQRFTLAPGFFNPLGQQLHGVMNRSLEKACSKGYVSQAEIEETKKVFRQTVLDI